MKLVAGIISTAALTLLLGMAAAPLYAQEQHEEQKDQQEQKDKPAKPEEKRAQPEEKKAEEARPAKQEEKTAQQDKNVRQEEKTQQQGKDSRQEEKNGQQHQQQAKSGQQQHGRIPDDKFQANFGREHTFHVSRGDYDNHRFQYGGYAFGFVGEWPSNWLYTQDVFVVDIDGVYYLCNPVYPGINLELSFAL